MSSKNGHLERRCFHLHLRPPLPVWRLSSELHFQGTGGSSFYWLVSLARFAS